MSDLSRTTAMSDNRKPIYSSDHPDRRVISAPNGLWTPQRRVSHTGDKTHDPWQDVHKSCDQSRALVTAFGPKTASQIA